MGDGRIVWVYCYDVEDDRTRARVARVLERQATRVQKSVFEARMTTRDAQALFDRLVREVDPGDSIRTYALPPASVARSMAHGGAPLPEDGDFWIA